jgi:primosomal protein N' (replication factor Y)
MPTFARVAVNVPGVTDLFDYAIPPEWVKLLQPGSLVEAPFGKQTVQGVVMRLLDQPDVAETRELAELLDEQPVLTANQLRLAEFLSETYFVPIGEFLNAMLPPGLGQRADTLYQLNLPTDFDAGSLSDLQRRLIDQLRRRGPLRGRQLEAAFRHVNWHASIRSLARAGLVTARPVLPPPAVGPKYARLACLSVPPEALPDALDRVGRPGSAAFERRQAVLRALADEGQPVDVSWVYAATGANSADLRYLEKQELITLRSQQVWRDSLAGKEIPMDEIPVLTSGQQQVWDTLSALLESGSMKAPTLLHGVTGSGKTELYLRVIQRVLEAGKQSIVLVPEISLTPQTIQRFAARFPGQVGVVHSRLSPGERLDTWMRARRADFPIVIGPRSALFTPFPNVGTIILDECHDDAFIQSDNPPFYSAVEAAIAYGRLNGGLVLLGSATPGVALYHRAQQERWPLLELPKRIRAHGERQTNQTAADDLPLPDVEVVDMRAELKSGNTSIFSLALHEALEVTLTRRQQAILLLNRRGSATYIFCRDCGYSFRCPRCELPLTLHQLDNELLCHTCGYRRNPPRTCPNCGGTRVKGFGTGTEKVESELKRSFPAARVLRWDADSTRTKDAQDIILAHFRQHQADFLIGTQMLAKGLDLPLVTLVGVVLADAGLNFPDYSTAERAFQLLTQVAGRAGRSDLGGRVLLQTFQPDHYAIRHAARHDFAGFYAQELDYRRQLNYPPFMSMIRFEVRHTNRLQARQAANELHARLKRLVESSPDRSNILLGPVPPYFARRAGAYRWQIILKGIHPADLLRGQDWRDVRVEVDPPSLL